MAVSLRALVALACDFAGLRIEIKLGPIAMTICGTHFVAATFTFNFFNIAKSI